jgi:hypothetical protein
MAKITQTQRDFMVTKMFDAIENYYKKTYQTIVDEIEALDLCVRFDQDYRRHNAMSKAYIRWSNDKMVEFIRNGTAKLKKEPFELRTSIADCLDFPAIPKKTLERADYLANMAIRNDQRRIDEKDDARMKFELMGAEGLYEEFTKMIAQYKV